MRVRTIGMGSNPEVRASDDVLPDFTGFTIFKTHAFLVREHQTLRNGSGSRKGERLVIGA